MALASRVVVAATSREADVVHVQQAAFSFLARDLSRIGVPLVVSCHANDVSRTALMGPGCPDRGRLLEAGLGGASRVTAVSGFTRDLASSAGAKEPISIIPPSVDASLFRAGGRDEARRELGLPLEARIVLSVGRLVPRKGHHALVDALATLEQDTLLAVVGEGPERSSLADRARVKGVEGRIHFRGRVSDQELRLCYRAADLFALPVADREDEHGLDCEGFGIVFLEAAAAELPVVAGRAGGVADAVVDGETGILVSPGDIDVLSQALSSLLDDRDRARAMGRAGHTRVVAEFAPETMVRRYEEVFAGVLARAAGV